MPRISFFLKTHAIAIVLLVVGLGGLAAYSATYQNPDAILRACESDPNKPLCYASFIEDLVRSRGIPEAFEALAVAYDNDPAFAGTCHAVTHDLGDAAYEEFHKTGKTELTSTAYYCGYGFYHGFLDALMLETGDLKGAQDFCTYVGKNVPYPPPPEFAEGSCYHGIGHGITDGTDPRLWGDALAIVRPGLVLCKKVAGGNNTWQSRCASGVFNALGNMYPYAKYRLDPGTNPYTLCREGKFSPIDEEQCYSQMNTQAAALGNDNLEKIVSFTNTIKDPHNRSVALKEAVSYYVQILKRAQKNLSVAEMKVCTLPTPALRESCIHGLIGGVFEFGSPGQQYKEALSVCAAESLSQEFRANCFTALMMNAAYYYTPEIASGVCADMPAEYKRMCTS